MASNGFILQSAFTATTTHTISASTVPVPPEEVLFRRKTAPQRYEEIDFYWAERNLTLDRPLPDSDLLKAIHTYASNFYDRATIDKGQGDYGSMDETALLALGILLEEAAKETLGATGDLAFIEGEEKDDGERLGGSSEQDLEAKVMGKSSGRGKKSKDSEATRKRKRRKLDKEEIVEVYDIAVR